MVRVSLLFALTSTLLFSCAADPGPFHVYGSPMLESSIHNRPLHTPAVGKRTVPPSGKAVAKRQKKQEDPGTRRPVRTQASGASDQAAPRTPSLSTRRATSSSSGSGMEEALEYVVRTLALNQVNLPEEATTSIASLYRHCREESVLSHSLPAHPGDLVFFHNTFDANQDGRNNDWYTHVAIVEKVVAGSTLQLVGYRDSEVETIFVNIESPEELEVNGKPANSRLREPSADDPPFTQHYAGQLFAGFCNKLGERSEFAVMERWRPGL